MPLCFLRAKPIGVMQMIDQGEQVCSRLAPALSLDRHGRLADLRCEAAYAVKSGRNTCCVVACCAADNQILLW